MTARSLDPPQSSPPGASRLFDLQFGWRPEVAVTEMEFCVLGPLLVRRGGVVVPVSPGRQRALLAALLLSANRVVPVDELAEALWGSAPPSSARASLQTYVMRLRKSLADAGPSRITAEPGGYRITIGAGELDAERFESSLAAGRTAARAGSHAVAAARLREALSLWRGQPLTGVPSETLALREVPRFAEMRLQALEARIEADLRLGRHAEMIVELRQLAAAEPLREHLHALLMLALYRQGQQAGALAAYQAARAVLVSELGAEPGPELRQLQQQVLAADPALAAPGHAGGTAARPGPLKEGPGEQGDLVPVPARQLPAAAAHFVGRAADLKVLDGLLVQAAGAEAGRTVVISAIGGTAGIGKTALAVHWAHQVAGRYPDGQLHVDLRGFAPSGLAMPPAEALRLLLDGLGVPPGRIPAAPDAKAGLYRSMLAGRRVLIVLDNARDPAQVRPLLPGSPGCLVLVTSRNQLTGLAAADGADLLALDVLTEEEAGQLLASRLGCGRVAAEPAAATELTGLCAGLPLALSIAAARAAARPGLPLAALAAELRDARTRLDALGTGDAATDVRTVFSWSYRQLTGPAARMFRLLGVHPGPDIAVPAAASLAGIPPGEARRTLAELAGACLITEHAPGRYACHDLLRAYATDRAEAQEQAVDRAGAIHRVLTWYLHAAGAAVRLIDPHRRHVTLEPPEPHCEPLSFDGYDQALNWLETERANLVAAVAAAGRHGAHEIAWKLPITLGKLFNLRGYRTDWIESVAVGLASARHLHDRAAEGWLLNHLAVAYLQSGSFSNAIGCLEEALVIRRGTGDSCGEAAALANLGASYSEAGQLRESLKCLRQALSVFRETGQQAELGRSLFIISATYRRLGRFEDAMTSARQAVDIIREVGDGREESGALTQLALADLCVARPHDAITHSTRAAELSRQHGHRTGEAEALAVLGQALQDCGHLRQARQHRRDAHQIFTDLGDPRAAEIVGLLDPQVQARR